MIAAVPGLALIAIWAAIEITATRRRDARIRARAATLITQIEEHLKKEAAR